MPASAEMRECTCGRLVNLAALSKCPACGLLADAIRQVTDADRTAAAAERAQSSRDRADRAFLSNQEMHARAEQAKREYVENALARLHMSLREGRTPYLHAIELLKTEYSVDGSVGGSRADVHLLAEYGWDGWEVVSSIPQTTGMSLKNVKGGKVSYGGGVGGLVDGALVLLRLPVTPELLSQRPEVVTSLLEKLYAVEGRPSTPQRWAVLPTGDLPEDPAPPPPSRGGAVTSFGVGMIVPFGD